MSSHVRMIERVLMRLDVVRDEIIASSNEMREVDPVTLGLLTGVESLIDTATSRLVDLTNGEG